MLQKTTYKMQHNFVNKIPSSASVCTARPQLQPTKWQIYSEKGCRGCQIFILLYVSLMNIPTYPPSFRSINEPTST